MSIERSSLKGASDVESIKINLGFMAEEVSSVLKPLIGEQKSHTREEDNIRNSQKLIEKMSTDVQAQEAVQESISHQAGSILIISRGDINDELFEQNLRCFGLEKYSDSAMTITANVADNPSSICHAIAQKLSEHLSGLNIDSLKIEGAKYKMGDFMTEGKPKLSVAQIGTGPVRQVCIQFPEMGFQSELAAQYARVILASLNDTNVLSNKTVAVQSYGAGGSVHQNLAADTLSNIEAVLCSRVHVDPTQQFKSLKAHIIELRNNLTTDQYAILMNEISKIETKFLDHHFDYSELFAQEALSKIRTDLAKWANIPVEKLLGTSDTKKKEYYAEISLTSPSLGKVTFFKSPSYDNRQVAEEVTRLVLLKMGGIPADEIDLSTVYLDYLTNQSSEYKTFLQTISKLENDTQNLSVELVAAIKESGPITAEFNNLIELDSDFGKLIEHIKVEMETIQTKLRDSSISPEFRQQLNTELESLKKERELNISEKSHLHEQYQNHYERYTNAMMRVNELMRRKAETEMRLNTSRTAKNDFEQQQINTLLKEAPKGHFGRPVSGKSTLVQVFEDEKALPIEETRKIL